ncbi:hemocyte protein-glutamine gamma-glutamyltransferase-like [Plakobranchus ocellatus]|uniref:Hemocyte protein-glutamine gamma-glutamyltransferase-like n=1 Tax=Plakobranchus ocellatus TaxID=259542 RepID=A0AAV4BWQ0_9GAST|nr:hemocyte protein-glutamine gamma-glutamyltransferase-like [Plakobranchus ocellatus]
MLDCALYLLEVGNLAWTSRGNPIPVVRKLSAMVNSNDDGGVLVGNWSGEYSDGKSPLSWTGSVAILEKYWENKRPVKFGQCWVFSGVITTVCRALGIPTRSVTNFASAHDTDGSVTIDVIFDDEGNRDDYLTDDSVWNFHVWNEAWMARPDLPKGFGGWQAIDATPQELSDGVFCCGPVSVHAIKQGEINTPYDAPFVFAEVNADRMYWMPSLTGKMECIGVDNKSVGKFVSTKEPNSWRRLDLTDTYKHPDGSAEERAAVLKANQVGSNRQDLYEKKEHDVTFSLEQDSENTWVGGNFEVILRIHNTSKKDRTVSGRMAVSSMYYTGVVATKLKSDPFEKIQLKPGQDLETCFYPLDDNSLIRPAPEVVKAATEFQVEVSFTNPLDSPLTSCFVAVDGLSKPLEFPQGNVSPKGTFIATLPITPKKLGHTELIVSFNSTQLEDINGSHAIFIQDK